MRVALGCCLFVTACGHQFLEARDVPGPPLVDQTVHRLQTGTSAAKISMLKSKAVLASHTAQAAAAQAATQKLKAEEIYVKTKLVLPELMAIKKTAKSQAQSAVDASKESVGAMKAMKKEMKTIKQQSQILAVQEVKVLLKQKYHQLSEWRHKVLTNPWEKSQVAVQKAAKPYFQMMGKFGASMAAYGLEAGNMKSQAAADAANAKALMAGVKAKRDAGDTVAAAQDQQMANALETQSKQLAARGATLEGQAAEMRNVMPEYAKGAQMAAWSAQHQVNPDQVPPPPVNPNFAYVGPR